MELKGCIVTIDAMGCQKDIAADIVEAGADCVLALKGNHAIAHEEFKEYFDDAVPPKASGHWGVETPLHWPLDVIFGEDQSRARNKNAAQNLATLRRIALNLIKNEKNKKLPARRKRMLAALKEDYLKLILGI